MQTLPLCKLLRHNNSLFKCVNNMKRFKTYGKVKVKQDMKTGDWDRIKEKETSFEESKPLNDSRTNTPSNTTANVIDTPQSVDDVSEILATLKITSHSTPVFPNIYADTSYSFKCRRSISFVNAKNNSLRKKAIGTLSTSVLEPNITLDNTSILSINSLFKDVLACTSSSPQNKLVDLCDQKSIASLKEFTESCYFVKKIGEGSFGEVFEKLDEESVAVKIVPFGGDTSVNCYPQMKAEEIIPEMAISKKLSCMCSAGQENYTNGFIQLHRCFCLGQGIFAYDISPKPVIWLSLCNGKYPENLIKMWEDWNDNEVSRNDHPGIFTDEQQYILFETNFGGTDLEKFPVKTYKEALSILHQIVAALASAEHKFEFEHRDLHWGNILVNKVKKTKVNMLIDDQPYIINTWGLNVSIIDFTMARLLSDDCVVFTDLSEEKILFEGKGDIQFEVYRSMKNCNRNEWEKFTPYTNVLWIQYVTKKLITKLSRSTATLKKFSDRVVDYTSARDMLYNDMLFKTT